MTEEIKIRNLTLYPDRCRGRRKTDRLSGCKKEDHSGESHAAQKSYVFCGCSFCGTGQPQKRDR